MDFEIEARDFSSFGQSFQDDLVKIILTDRPFADQMEEVLDVEYFEQDYQREIIRTLYNLRREYGKHPALQTIATAIKTEESCPEVLQVQCFGLLGEAKQTPPSDVNFVKDKSLFFCKRQHVRSSLHRAYVTLIAQGREDQFDTVSRKLLDAFNAGSLPDEGHDLLADFETRYEKNDRGVVETSLPRLNRITAGGPGRGELNVIIAGTGGGKSFFLVAVGGHAVTMGKRVYHYTLELQAGVVGKRYDTFLSGISLNHLDENKEEVYEKVSSMEGSVSIREYPTRSIGTRTIRSQLEKARQNGEPVDMVVVDYADLLRGDGKHEKRIQLEFIYEELRGIAMEFDCVVWTASQTNRQGLNAEVITLESIAESFNKCMVSDLILTISRTRQDKVANRGKMLVAKNRNGPDGMVFAMKIDPEFCLFEFMTDEESMMLADMEDSRDDIASNFLKALQGK